MPINPVIMDVNTDAVDAVMAKHGLQRLYYASILTDLTTSTYQW